VTATGSITTPAILEKMVAPLGGPRQDTQDARLGQSPTAWHPPRGIRIDRRRSIDGPRSLAAAPDGAFPTNHAVFGTMTPQDWRHRACRHTDYHLKQFGL